MTKTEELAFFRDKYPDISPILIFKISMTKYGCVFSKRALAKLQEPYYRFTKAEPFGISLEIRKEDFYTPGAVSFRDGSSVLVNYGEPYKDPYLIDYDEKADVFLAKEGDRIADIVDFIPRPQFFDHKTSKGTTMDLLGGTCTGQRLLINAFQKCRFWEHGEQCHYCALFSAPTVLPEVDQDENAETVKEALKEPGRFTEISFSGGSDFGGDPPFSDELERYIRLLNEIGAFFGDKPEFQLQAPAYRKEWAKRLYEETPLSSYRPNVEIWDKDMFERRCPGKTRWVGRDEWVKRITDAVEVFGKGRVYTQMVCGAETAKPEGLSAEQGVESCLEGCEFFSKNGVSCHEEMWRPHRMEKLGWQDMQDIDYFIRIASGFHDLHKKYGITSVKENFMRGSDNPDSDLERADPASDIPVRREGSARKMKADDYTAARIPEEVAALLRSEDRKIILELPATESYGRFAGIDVTDLTQADQDRILIAVPSEHSILSGYLIKSIWYRAEVILHISAGGNTVRVRMNPYRNHLVGKYFRRMLDWYRSKGKGDMAQTVEMHYLSHESAENIDFHMIEDHSWSRPHLDMQ